MSQRPSFVLPVVLLALAPAWACTSFEDVSTVLDLRVLAIATDPSEVVLKVDGPPIDPTAPLDLTALMALSIDPASIPPIHVTPLLVDPPAAADGRAVTWSLAACPNNPFGPAPPAGMGGGPDPSGGARTTVGSTLCPMGGPNTWALGAGLAAGASLDVTFTPEQLFAAFKADLYPDQYGQWHGGYDLGLPMNLELTATDGVVTTKAVKRVLFWSSMLPGQVPNNPPKVPVVDVYRARDEKTWDPIGAVTPLDPTTPVRVAPGTVLWLRPDLTGDVETDYVTTVIDRKPPHLAMPTTVARERIRFAFYATAGHFEPARTVSELPPGVPGIVHLESKYVPPATLDDVPVDASGARIVPIWVVVRDDRGGESWLEARLALEP